MPGPTLRVQPQAPSAQVPTLRPSNLLVLYTPGLTLRSLHSGSNTRPTRLQPLAVYCPVSHTSSISSSHAWSHTRLLITQASKYSGSNTRFPVLLPGPTPGSTLGSTPGITQAQIPWSLMPGLTRLPHQASNTRLNIRFNSLVSRLVSHQV
jgi:hypothetical protein